MENSYQNSTTAQIIDAIINQLSFEGESKSDIADILLSILNQTPYEKEPSSVIAELFIKLKAKIEGESFEPFDKPYISNIAEIIKSILDETEYNNAPNSRIAELLLELKEQIEEDFTELTASGTIASFETNVSKPLVACDVDENATKVFHCRKNLYFYDENKISVGETTTQTTRAYYNLGLKNVKLTFSASLKSGSSITQSDYLNIGILRKSDGLIEILSQFITPDGITTRTLSISSDDDVILVSLENPNVIKSILSRYDIQIEVGSSASDFEIYNGKEYNVADIGNINTFIGVNNIFTDNGEISVTYLYKGQPILTNNAGGLLGMDTGNDENDAESLDVDIENNKQEG